MTTTERPKVIVASEVVKALIAAGILPDGQRTRRVVIDLKAGRHEVPIIYVEYYGDERLLQVGPTLEGVEIRGVPAEKSQVESQ